MQTQIFNMKSILAIAVFSFLLFNNIHAQKMTAQDSLAKKVKDSVEKTTLGDMDVLSNLKADMEESEKKSKKSE